MIHKMELGGRGGNVISLLFFCDKLTKLGWLTLSIYLKILNENQAIVGVQWTMAGGRKLVGGRIIYYQNRGSIKIA